MSTLGTFQATPGGVSTRAAAPPAPITPGPSRQDRLRAIVKTPPPAPPAPPPPPPVIAVDLPGLQRDAAAILATAKALQDDVAALKGHVSENTAQHRVVKPPEPLLLEVQDTVKELRAQVSTLTGAITRLKDEAKTTVHTKEVVVKEVPVTTKVVERHVPSAPPSEDPRLMGFQSDVSALRAAVEALTSMVGSLKPVPMKRRVIRDDQGLITGSVEEPMG